MEDVLVQLCQILMGPEFSYLNPKKTDFSEQYYLAERLLYSGRNPDSAAYTLGEIQREGGLGYGHKD